MLSSLRRLTLLATALLLAGTSFARQPALTDTVRAGRYDNGKMWTFEYPPTDYLEETYDFRPDADWFERARLSALRIPGCSAAFVSSTGLVVTNHHCVRLRMPQVTRPGEHLLDEGFYAPSLAEERQIPGYYADQLIAIEDVTDEVYGALTGQETAAERAQARSEAFDAITARLQETHGGEGTGIEVQVISLYNGGRYSAYVFRRYNDVRLVLAVELQLGFFGGEWDNFTYPRYALDFAFLRVYGDDGQPLVTPHHFTFSQTGVQEGDLVFVIGNPGSTSRLLTVAQLEYLRDVQVKHTLRFLNNRLDAFRAFYAEDPEAGEALNVRNTIFSISNSQKAYSGRNDALNDPWLIARRQDAERQFSDAIEKDPALKVQYQGLFDRLAAIQQELARYGEAFGAFRSLGHPLYDAALMHRALLAYQYLTQQAQAGDSEAVEKLKEQVLAIADRPHSLEARLLSVRLDEFQHHFGQQSDLAGALLHGDTPDVAAAKLFDTSVLATAEGSLTLDDPALRLVSTLWTRYQDFQSAMAGLSAREDELSSALGRARFDIYGTAVPPDATFSPRVTDGIVKGYPYNGTEAPAYTTFYGMYDRHFGFGNDPDWALPERWRTPPANFNRATPLNFASTSDTIGGNSGSPVVTRALEIVGINFDRNVEGLSRDYIYLPERGRNMAVDVRAIREALDVMYDADRIVLEVTQDRMAPTEAEADAILQQ